MSARIQSAEAARGAPPLPAAPSAGDLVRDMTPAEQRVLAVIMAARGRTLDRHEIAGRARVSPKSVPSIVFLLREKGVPVESRGGHRAPSNTPGYWIGKERDVHSYSTEVAPRPWRVGETSQALGVALVYDANGQWTASCISHGTAHALVKAVNAEYEARKQAAGVPDMSPPA